MSFDFGSLLGPGLGLLGGLFGGSDKTNSQTNSSTSPWDVQAPFLQAGFMSGADLYNRYLNKGFYGGDLYANLNPTQRKAIRGMTGLAGGLGNDVYRSMLQGAGQFNGQIGNFLNTANGLANFQPLQSTDVSSLLNFDPGNAQRSNLRDANRYMNNGVLRGQIDAASRDVTRNLTENVLPGQNVAAAAGGNGNSTRTGIAQGIALRGAQDRIGDIAAQMRGDAYNNGLNLAENSRQFNQGLRYNGLYNGLNLMEQGRQSDMNAMLNGMNSGAGWLNTALGRGMDMQNQGMQGLVNMLGLQQQAGGLLQNNQQNQINSNLYRWQQNYNMPWDLLSKYMGTVGGANYGSNTVRQDVTPGSWQGALQGALGGLTSGMGLYKDFSQFLNAGAGNNYNVGQRSLY